MATAPASAVWQAVEQEAGAGRHNWSGSLMFRPAQIFAPRDEGELAGIVVRAREAGRTVRPIGSGHSSTPIIATDDILVSLEHFAGVQSEVSPDHEVDVGAGGKLDALSEALLAQGVAFPNYGDIATQAIAGVISTGTHGSGRTLHNLSMMLCGGRFVTGTGAILDFDEKSDPGFVRAIRVAMGTAGIFTRVRLRLLPAYELRRIEWCTDMRTTMGDLERLGAENRNFDLYWYPRSDVVKLRCLNPPERATDYSSFARRVEDRTGPPHEVIPKHSGLPFRFEEMEYAVPLEAGPACFAAVRRRILERWRRTVGWRVLYRLVKGDDSWLSEAHGRDTVTISLHQNASLPYAAFFADIEPIFRAHGGRPHWAKQHSLLAADLEPLYPRWRDFLAFRDGLDPDGVFMTPYLRRLFGVPA
ncbi:MAG: D-arabinono-1,4-lactone oxidase [Bauldia sp.]